MFPSENENGGVVLFNEGPSIIITSEQDKILGEMLANYATEVNTTAAVVLKENNNVESKKSAHRDIERQRRQEMSLLYSSLRSLLPLQYVKGKRAVSDHMHQAVIYIKHMQMKNEEMRIKIEKLNKLTNNVSETRSILEDRVIIEAAANSSPTYCVKINVCNGGGINEILITSSSSIDNGSFSLSKVFVKLLQRGFNVISCVSTRVDNLFLHKIQIDEVIG
ncbi:PREDICTED: transcription factor bHLH125-like [Erythranthe guttata]|uniref:transcription factor bHLH125-like n=1 Tax=Erythranthe guttata TaxID=4155 RepID=UPI00064D7F3F|nr:PREDICTED: transcription factor bHLH125-like [Erythranthe guttata]|eukprot:XP_012857558.1 PREDICTED: transcription factor bHLH125-like [Erythranthe guttata]